jgi:xylan 1,4-beta-xylosidase
VIWSEDGWLRLAHGGTEPQLHVPGPANVPPHPWPIPKDRDDFDALQLQAGWQSLRVPVETSWLSLAERPGWLRLRGRESQHSLFEQRLIARRLTSVNVLIATAFEFDPVNFMQSAGLILYYDTRNHFYLRLTHDESRGKLVILTVTDDGHYSESGQAIDVNDWKTCHMRASMDEDRTQFYASPDGAGWQAVGPSLDTFKLSDDYGSGLKFTGTMAGICCQDLSGTRATADFDYFELRTTGFRDAK